MSSMTKRERRYHRLVKCVRFNRVSAMNATFHIEALRYYKLLNRLECMVANAKPKNSTCSS